MRYSIPSALVLLGVSAIVGCKGKPSLSPDDEQYVRTTIDLMRLRSSLVVASDSNETNRRFDSVYHKHTTSRNNYLAETKSIGSDPSRASVVYAAIKDSLKDSLGVK